MAEFEPSKVAFRQKKKNVEEEYLTVTFFVPCCEKESYEKFNGGMHSSYNGGHDHGNFLFL